MEEGIITSYLNRLANDANPGVLLTTYYLELHRLPSTAFGSLIPTISKLVRLYGRNIVFHAITTTVEIADVDHTNVSRLLIYLCKKDLQNTTNEVVLLDDTAKAIEKKIKKIKIDDLRSPFDD